MLKYSKQREQFGKALCKHQALAFMMADMDIRTEASRQLVRHACSLVDAGIIDARQGSIAKTFAGDSAVQTALDAIQILGGYGYSREYPVEKLLRDAKIYQIFEGTNEIQRVIISSDLYKG